MGRICWATRSRCTGMLIKSSLKIKEPPDKALTVAIDRISRSEKWVDVRTGKPCGRQKGESRAYPYCRPSKRVSSKTPKTSSELTAAEKRSRLAQKKSSKKVERVTRKT